MLETVKVFELRGVLHVERVQYLWVTNKYPLPEANEHLSVFVSGAPEIL